MLRRYLDKAVCVFGLIISFGLIVIGSSLHRTEIDILGFAMGVLSLSSGGSNVGYVKIKQQGFTRGRRLGRSSQRVGLRREYHLRGRKGNPVGIRSDWNGFVGMAKENPKEAAVQGPHQRRYPIGFLAHESGVGGEDALYKSDAD